MAVGGRGGESRGSRVGWPGKKNGVGRARMNRMISNYSNRFQMSSNGFDQRVDSRAPKIPNKIWMERA
jgi:hypothetical protein